MLALLDRGPAHGYELKRAHDELFGDVAPPVNIGQIYVTLTRLERDGSVVHRLEKGTEGPDRKVYELTETGRKALRGWLDEPSELPVGKSDVVQRLVAGLIYDATARRRGTGRGHGDQEQAAGPGAAAGASTVARTIAEHRTRCLRALRTLVETGAGPGGATSAWAADDADTTESVVAGVGELLREASVLHLQAELRWLDIVEARLTRTRRA